MSLSGPDGHRLVIVSPERTDPIEPRTAERRANRYARWYDLGHIVQTRALVRVQIVGGRLRERLIIRREVSRHQQCDCRDNQNSRDDTDERQHIAF